MLCKTSLCCAVFLCAAALPVSNANIASRRKSNTRTLQEKLGTRLSVFNTGTKPMVNVLVGLAFKYHLPLGLQYVDEAAVHRKLHLKLSNPTLIEALEETVRKLPEYKLDVAGGVVQIYSPKARAEPSNLLNARIRNFEVDGVDPHQASADLGCSLARKVNPRIICFRSIVPGQWGALRITLHMRNARVYEIIDAIAAQTRGAIWTVLVPPNETSSLGKDLWHIYPPNPAFRQTAIERLQTLFPSATPGDVGNQ